MLEVGSSARLQIFAPCLQADVLAGTSVAALVVPQGMSYAALAGLPSVYGLYGAFVPVLCYAALGSSRHLVSIVESQPGSPSPLFPCSGLDLRLFALCHVHLGIKGVGLL